MKFDKYVRFMLYAYILLSLCMVALGYHFVLNHQEADLKEAKIAFMKAIEKERALYTPNFIFSHNPELSPDPTISGHEKQNYFLQKIFIIKDPTRHRLDSIFQAELDSLNIQGTVAIQCIEGDTTTISRSEFPFEKAIALESVSYRKDSDNKHTITIQPYLYLSGWMNNKSVYMLLLIWLSGTALFIYIIRKRYRQQPVTPLHSVNEKTESMIIKPHQPEIKVEWTMLSKNIFFDEKHGVLKRNEKEIILTGDSLNYFRNFIRKENFMLTYQDILQFVYDITTDEISKNNRSRISHGIDRLQNQLNEMGDLQIKLVRSQGYQLEVSQEEEEG